MSQRAFGPRLFIGDFDTSSVDDLREDIFHLFISTAILTPFPTSLSFPFHLFEGKNTFLVEQPLSKFVVLSSNGLRLPPPQRNVKSPDSSRTLVIQWELLGEPPAANVNELPQKQLILSPHLQVVSFL